MKMMVAGRIRALWWAGLFSVLVGTGYAQQVTEIEPGLYSTGELKATAKISSVKKLLVRSATSLSGSLTIVTAEGASVTLGYRIQARSDNRKKGVDYVDLISVSMASVADEIRIEMRAPNPAPWEENADAGMVHAMLTVPPGCAIDIEATSFDVTANGPFREIVIPSSLGRLEISDVTSKLDVSTANQRVSLENISGDIAASTTNAKLTARALSCGGKPAKLRNESGDIKVDGAKGELNIRNSYGRTEIVQFTPTGGGSFIRSSSGPVLVDVVSMTDGRVVIVNEYEDIELRLAHDLSAALALTVDEDGTIDASQIQFVADLVEHNHLNLRMGQGVGSISASVRGKGNILVRGGSGE